MIVQEIIIGSTIVIDDCQYERKSHLQIFVRVVILGGVLVLAVDVIQLARAEAVQDLGDLVGDGRISANGADGVHVRPRLSSVPDQAVQRQVLHRSRLGELGREDGVRDGERVPLTRSNWTFC